jgi:hypothetical protein
MFRLAALWTSTLILCLAVGLAFCRLPYTSGHMDPDGPIGWPPIQCGRPCVIEESHGGIIALFTVEAYVLKATGTPVIVDGPCISACTILVDIDADNVCVTTNAVFGYHKASGPKGFAPIVFKNPKLNAYIAAHGGEPDPDSGDLLMVGFNDLTQFYKPCAGAV